MKIIEASSKMIRSEEWIGDKKLRTENIEERSKAKELKFINKCSKGKEPSKRT